MQTVAAEIGGALAAMTSAAMTPAAMTPALLGAATAMPSLTAADLASAAPTPPTPPTPAAQLGPTLAAFGTSPAGAPQVTVQLHPESLGRVQISLIQPKDGPANVQITAEQPATLALLVRDQGQLQQALDRAGAATAGTPRLSFHLAPPETPTTANPASATAAAANSGAGSGSGNASAPWQEPAPRANQPAPDPGSALFQGSGGQSPASAFTSSGQGGNQGQAATGRPTRTGFGAVAAAAGTAGSLPPAWLRAGIDITA